MANTSSAKKAYRQSVKRTKLNKHHRSLYRNAVRSTLSTINGNDHGGSMESLRKAQSLLFKAVKHGLISHNTASRKVKRLNHKIKALLPAA